MCLLNCDKSCAFRVRCSKFFFYCINMILLHNFIPSSWKPLRCTLSTYFLTKIVNCLLDFNTSLIILLHKKYKKSYTIESTVSKLSKILRNINFILTLQINIFSSILPTFPLFPDTNFPMV